MYGSGQSFEGPYGSVIPKISEKIARGETPIIYGDGFQSRDFIHVSDVAQSILKLLNIHWDGTISPVYNIATQRQTSLLDLIEIINSSCLKLGLIQNPLKPVFEETRSGDIQHSVASIERVTKEIGWKPLMEIEHGIHQLIKQNWGIE